MITRWLEVNAFPLIVSFVYITLITVAIVTIDIKTDAFTQFHTRHSAQLAQSSSAAVSSSGSSTSLGVSSSSSSSSLPCPVVQASNDITSSYGTTTWNVNTVGCYTIGMRVQVTWTGDSSDYMQGCVTGLNSHLKLLVVDADIVSGPTNTQWSPWVISFISETCSIASSSSSGSSSSFGSTASCETYGQFNVSGGTFLCEDDNFVFTTNNGVNYGNSFTTVPTQGLFYNTTVNDLDFSLTVYFNAVSGANYAGSLFAGIIITNDTATLYQYGFYQTTSQSNPFDILNYNIILPIIVNVAKSGSTVQLSRTTPNNAVTWSPLITSSTISTPPGRKYVGVFISGLGNTTVTISSLTISFGVTNNYSTNVQLTPQYTVFQGTNPSNNYQTNQILSWDPSPGANTYTISYAIQNNTSPTVMISGLSTPTYMLSTLSSQYAYTVFITPVNLFGNGLITNVTIPNTLFSSFPIRNVSNMCGSPGIDYIPYNTFGQYVIQIPTSNCSSQWVQVYGAYGGGDGGFVTAITQLTPGMLYTFIVGQAGEFADGGKGGVYGGGFSSNNGAGNGGGFSGIFEYNDVSVSGSILVVGGGGGSGSCGIGGNGTGGLYSSDVFCNGVSQPNTGASSLSDPTIVLRASSYCTGGGSGGGYGVAPCSTSANTPGGGGSGFNQSVVILNNIPSCLDQSSQTTDGAIFIACYANVSNAETLTTTPLNDILFPEQPINDTILPAYCQLNSQLAPPGSYAIDYCIPPVLPTQPDNTMCLSNRTFYISYQYGSNTNSGLTMNAPLQDITLFFTQGGFGQQHPQITLIPGDQVLLCRGDRYFASFNNFRLFAGTFDPSWVYSNCSVKFAAWTCNSSTSNSTLPALFGAYVLPQVTNVIGWTVVPHTLLNGSVVSAYQYNLTALQVLSPSYLGAVTANGGVSAMFVGGINYLLARHPNLDAITGDLSMEGLTGTNFNEVIELDGFSPLPYGPFVVSAGSWCRHFYNDLFGQNTTLMNNFLNQPNPFGTSFISLPSFFQYFYFQLGSGNFVPPTINCQAWFNKYINATWFPTLDYESTDAYLLDAFLLTSSDANNVSNWKLPTILNAPTNPSVNSPSGPYNGIPSGDPNHFVFAPPTPPGATVLGGKWGYGSPIWMSQPCYFLDMGGEYCIENNIISLIPLNAAHASLLLNTQTLPLPWTNTMVGMNTSTAGAYILPIENNANTAIFNSDNGAGSPDVIMGPNWEFQELRLAYAGGAFAVGVLNIAIHHCIMHDFISPYYIAAIHLSTMDNTVNPIGNNASSVVIHNNIIYNVTPNNAFQLTFTTAHILINNTIYSVGNGIGLGSFYNQVIRGNYIYNTANVIDNGFQALVSSEYFDLVNTIALNWQQNRFEYNYINLTNNNEGSYASVSFLMGIVNGNLINNSMDGAFFQVRSDGQTPALSMYAMWQNVTNNIFWNSVGGVTEPSFWDGWSENPQCAATAFQTFFNNLIIDDFSDMFLLSVTNLNNLPDGHTWCPDVSNITIDSNTQIFLTFAPGTEFVGATLTNPGTNWRLGFSSLELNPQLNYQNQPDVINNVFLGNYLYEFRMTDSLNILSPAVLLTDQFLSFSDYTLVSSSNINYYDTVYGMHINILSTLTDGLANATTFNPIFYYGYDYVYNTTQNLYNELQWTNCQAQMATEQYYRDLVVNFFAHYTTPNCWPPMNSTL